MGFLYKRSSRGKWYGSYTGADGKTIRRTTGTRDKTDATRILRQWEDAANLARHGLHNTNARIDTLLTQYMIYLNHRSDVHREKTEQRLRRIIDACGYVWPHQLDRVQIETIVRQFAIPSGKKTISLRTQSHYIAAIKSFSAWLVVAKALPADPLATLRKPNFDRDRRLTRRFLLPKEWTWLRLTERWLLYATAIQTGLRSSELRALRPSHVHDDHILLPAKYTKDGQQARQYIAPELAPLLRDTLPFEMPAGYAMAAMLEHDLATARAMWCDAGNATPEDFLCKRNAAGHVLDFHALRHTTGAWLAIGGTNPKVIQSIMRHSTITLTLDTYGHLMPGAEQDAASVISSMLCV